MTKNAAMKDRILKVMTAILQPEGFTTQWYASGRRGIEMRETFRFDTSERMQAIAGDSSAFVHHIESRRTETKALFTSLPDNCDWRIDELVDWIQDLEEADVTGLPDADLSLEPVRLMGLILDTADDDRIKRVEVGFQRWRADYASAYDAPRPIILVMVRGPVDDKWGAETFLQRTT